MSSIKKWEIHSANLEPVIGSEQGKRRPVLIISENEINELLNCVNVIPISSLKPGRFIYPNEVLLETEVSSLPNTSIALCHQIRTIDKRRISKIVGKIEEENIKDSITEAICFQLGI